MLTSSGSPFWRLWSSTSRVEKHDAGKAQYRIILIPITYWSRAGSGSAVLGDQQSIVRNMLVPFQVLVFRREEGESALWFVEKEPWSAVPRAGYDEKRQALSKYEVHVIWRTWSMINGFGSLQMIPCLWRSALSSQSIPLLFLLPSFSPLPVLVLFQNIFLCWMGSTA